MEAETPSCLERRECSSTVNGTAIVNRVLSPNTSRPRMAVQIMVDGVGTSEDRKASKLTTILVYTCQKPQPKRCNFFLWDDEAKVREESAVLNNSRSEPAAPPQTPSKAIPTAQTRTPSTDSGSRTASDDEEVYTPSKSSGANSGGRAKIVPTAAEDDAFDWPSSNDEDLLEAAGEIAAKIPMPPPETPRKAAKTITFSSPGKRTHQDMESSSNTIAPSPGDDVFATPGTSNKLGLPSPAETPTPGRYKNEGGSAQDSDLATSTLTLLNSKAVHLEKEVEAELVGLLNRHDLKTQGIVKGRDISRLAIKAKNKKISELQARIAGLEAERETQKAVIGHLKTDISTPRGKGRGRGRGQP